VASAGKRCCWNTEEKQASSHRRSLPFKIHQARLFKEEEGQTLVEYGLLVALIALVVIAALMILGQKVANTFNAINKALPE